MSSLTTVLKRTTRRSTYPKKMTSCTTHFLKVLLGAQQPRPTKWRAAGVQGVLFNDCVVFFCFVTKVKDGEIYKQNHHST